MEDKELDIDVLEDLYAALGPRVGALVDRFETLIPTYLDAFQTPDAEKFRRAAHTLKSAAGALGLAALSVRARTMEEGGPVLPGDLADLGSLATRSCAALRTWLQVRTADGSSDRPEDPSSGRVC